MADGTFYRLEALDFNFVKIGDLQLQLRAMPKDLLVVRVPERTDFEGMRAVRKELMEKTGLEVLITTDRVAFLRLVEVVDPALSLVEPGRLAGRSVRLVGD